MRARFFSRERVWARVPGCKMTRDKRVGVAEVLREFLGVHKQLAELVTRYRSRNLSFELVEDLVGDDNSSALYRLKEKCHAIFREAPGGVPAEFRTEALFDLAIGSLFHEAMILRENLYQQERYGSRVGELKANLNPLAPELSREFERILGSSASRLEEAVSELDALLALTSNQLIRLLAEDVDNELLARCIYEESEAVEAVFSQGFLTLLEEVYGSEEVGLMKAANSYIESAYYDQALEVMGRLPSGDGLAVASAFAGAMQAFLARDYPRCAECLSRWLEAYPENENENRISLALAAAKHIAKVQGGDLSAAATTRLSALRDRAKESARQPAD